jgi:hypothetical protein
MWARYRPNAEKRRLRDSNLQIGRFSLPNPAAGNKRTNTGLVSGGGTFPVRNGRTRGSVTLNPVGPGSFSCPGGQTMYLVGACYNDITLNIGGAEATEEQVCRNDLMVRQ